MVVLLLVLLVLVLLVLVLLVLVLLVLVLLVLVLLVLVLLVLVLLGLVVLVLVVLPPELGTVPVVEVEPVDGPAGSSGGNVRLSVLPVMLWPLPVRVAPATVVDICKSTVPTLTPSPLVADRVKVA